LESEPGCQRFDVFQPLTDAGAPDHARIMLCEVYDDMAAFELHRAKPRHPDMAETASMLDGRVLTICELV
jgi:quinol monooxygenase YgiN